MAQPDDVAIKSLAQINHDVFLSPKLIFHDHLRLGQVNVEVIEGVFQFANVILQCLLLMEELNQRESLQLIDQRFSLLFKIVHLGPHLILLLQHVVTHVVQCVVKHLENALNFELVTIEFAHQGLFLLGVDHFQGDKLLL